jgi:hypothetical protein
MTLNPAQPTPRLNPTEPTPRLNVAAPPFRGRPLAAVVASAQPRPSARARVTTRRVVRAVPPSVEVDRHGRLELQARERRERAAAAAAFEALTASAHQRGFWYPCWALPALTAAATPGDRHVRCLCGATADGGGTECAECTLIAEEPPPLRPWEFADMGRRG